MLKVKNHKGIGLRYSNGKEIIHIDFLHIEILMVLFPRHVTLSHPTVNVSR